MQASKQDPLLAQAGYLLARQSPTLDEMQRMPLEVLAFMVFWTRESDQERYTALSRMLGVSFTAGEIRGWFDRSKPAPERAYRDDDQVLLPLSFILKPELREALSKMLGTGAAMPAGYEPKHGEKIVDLGKLSVEQFRAFVERREMPDLTPVESEDSL